MVSQLEWTSIHHGQRAGGDSGIPTWLPSYSCSHCWVTKSLDYFVFLCLEFNQYHGPSIPLPSELDFHSLSPAADLQLLRPVARLVVTLQT